MDSKKLETLLSYKPSDFRQNDDKTLKHHGVKGMKWGVVRWRTPGGKSGQRRKSESSLPGVERDSTTTGYAFYRKAIERSNKNLSIEKSVSNIRSNQDKLASKVGFDNSEGSNPKDKIRAKRNKRIMYALVGAAIIGGVAYLGYRNRDALMSAYRNMRNSETILSSEERNRIKELGYSIKPGEKVSLKDFLNSVEKSQDSMWSGNGYVNKSSFDREEFSIPSNTIFNRLSKEAETEYYHKTYATLNLDDFNRYVSAFRNEFSMRNNELNKVTFSSNREIKVPNLKTTLSGLEEALKQTYPNSHFSSDKVLDYYNELSGGSWSDKLSENFFNNLISKGYSAIVDEMDAGVIADRPLMIFDHSGFTDKVSEKMTSEMYRQADLNLKELLNRKL